MKTTIDGVEITSAMAEVLGEWHETAGPERYVSYLSDIQDFLCYQLQESEYCQKAERLLLHIIYIKDDLKRFIPEKGADS
jgi:hypothetical protein